MSLWGKVRQVQPQWEKVTCTGFASASRTSGISEPDRQGASDSQRRDPDFAHCEKMETERERMKYVENKAWCWYEKQMWNTARGLKYLTLSLASPLAENDCIPCSFYSQHVCESIVACYIRPQSWKGKSHSTSVLQYRSNAYIGLSLWRRVCWFVCFPKIIQLSQGIIDSPRSITANNRLTVKFISL